MADRPSTPLAGISLYRPILHESLGNFSPQQHHTWTGDSVTSNPETIWQQRDKYFRVIFTFVQGQTPVTPPTLANTKENWIEEGTDHVICLGTENGNKSHYMHMADIFTISRVKFTCCLFGWSSTLKFANTRWLEFQVNLEWIGHPRGAENGSVLVCFLSAHSLTLIQNQN